MSHRKIPIISLPLSSSLGTEEEKLQKKTRSKTEEAPTCRAYRELSVLERRGMMESGTKRRVGTHTRFIQGGYDKWMTNG
jgi:hypothetical protein